MSRIALIAAATISVIAAAGPALAQPTVVAPTDGRAYRVVSFADLDLGSAAGKTSLDRRLRSAVAYVCPSGNVRVPAEHTRGRNCARVALADAFAQRDVLLARMAGGERIAALTVSAR